MNHKLFTLSLSTSSFGHYRKKLGFVATACMSKLITIVLTIFLVRIIHEHTYAHTHTLVAVSKACPKGWTTVGERCFKYDATKRNYDDSVKHCTSQGAQIASIHNDEENNAVIKMQVVEAAYLGAESDGMGNWKWHDGTPWWNPGGGRSELKGVAETRIALEIKTHKWYDWKKGEARLGVFCAKNLQDASSGIHPSHTRYACPWPVWVSISVWDQAAVCN